MAQIGDEVLGYRLVAHAELPELGEWFAGAPSAEGVAVWVRPVPPSDVDHRLGAERLRHMDHPALPKLVASDDATGAIAVAAPAGVPLDVVIARRHEPEFAMSPGTVLDAAVQLADALMHAHEKGRPHGHVSPDRMWLTPKGRLVLWGISDGPGRDPEPAWASPERARGNRASGDADQWALGAVTAALVTGRVPWPGADALSLARVGDAGHLSAPVLDQWKPLGRVVERTLHDDTRSRFPSIHPVWQALHAMSERVRQPSALASMGAALAGELGLPGDADLDEESPTVVTVDDLEPLDPEEAPAPPAHLSASQDDAGVVPSPAPDAVYANEVATLEPELPEVTDGTGDWHTGPAGAADQGPAGPAQLGDGERMIPLPTGDPDGVETYRPTTPTYVPAMSPPTVEPGFDDDDDDDDLPAPVPPAPRAEGASDGPSTLGDVAVADRIPVDPRPPDEDRPAVLTFAPWVVGVMVALLLLFMFGGMG